MSVFLHSQELMGTASNGSSTNHGKCDGIYEKPCMYIYEKPCMYIYEKPCMILVKLALQKITNWQGIIMVLKVLLSNYIIMQLFILISYVVGKQPALVHVVDARQSRTDDVSGVCM